MSEHGAKKNAACRPRFRGWDVGGLSYEARSSSRALTAVSKRSGVS
jgi:hypothetical protein